MSVLSFFYENLKFFDYLFPVMAFLCFSAVIIVIFKTIKNLIRFNKDDVIVKLEINIYGNLWAVLGTFVLLVTVLIINDYSIIMLSILGMIISLTLLSLVFCLSKSGVTKNGVYVSCEFIKFEELTDYYIDTVKNNVTFSCNLKGGLTLKGITRAVYFSEADEEILVQVLKDKNIVQGKIIIR